jgi:peptidyl-prolyl cis-trans isomerase C/peptidyl-prolyl cis-trans isomerase D
MKKDFLSKTIIMAVFVSFGVLGARAIQAATELARVNGTSITLEDFNKRYQESLKYFQFKAPSKKNVLDDIIKRELGIQEAKKLGLDRDPEVIDRMNTVLYQAFLDKKLSKQFDDIQVTDAEAKAFYSKYPEIRTSHIFIAVRPDASKQEVAKAYAKIKEIHDKYLAPGKMSFAEVAQHYSEGVAAPQGGDIDYQTREQLDPAYYDTAVKLRMNKVSGIVRSQFGYHIIKLTGIKSWDEVDRPGVKRAVIDQRRKQIFESYMTQLRNHNKVTVHAELLR